MTSEQTGHLDPLSTYDALRHGVVARRTVRDIVVVRGPQGFEYLQGQCSQDLANMAIGEQRESLLLSPQGKFEAYVRVVAVDDEVFVVEGPAGQGDVLYERLRRFKLRVKAELEQASLDCIEVRGPTAKAPEVRTSASSYVALVNWPGLSGYDLLGAVEVPIGVAFGADEAFEVARIEAGQPVVGAELNEKTIPPEAGIVERTVSFTKGCFTGQELVARLDARGNRVARRLCGFVFEKDHRPSAGDEVEIDGEVRGVLTSVAGLPGRGVVALGYLVRAVEVPSQVRVGGLPGQAVSLPIMPLTAMSENR